MSQLPFQFKFREAGLGMNVEREDLDKLEQSMYDCWNITSLITYHYNYPNQVISQYGDPLIDEMISLLKFENYGHTISDQSGNDNDAYIYSLPNNEAEFVETGF